MLWAATQTMKIPFLSRSTSESQRPCFSHQEESPLRLMMEASAVDALAREMNESHQGPRSENTVSELQADIRERGPWFQRIELSEGLTTTSELRDCLVDEGGLNNLGGRLSPEVASAMRPLPKWRLLQAVLPRIAGRSVLDLGCNAGFFCFAFEELGAERVTGVEFMEPYFRQAQWCKEQRGSQVRFVQGDFVLDQSLEMHDVVFASEVLNHCLFPLYALARMLRLAREFVVIDTGIHKEAQANLRLALYPDQKYHSFTFSDGMMLDFLQRLGVSPGQVQRFVNPVASHLTYVLNVQGGVAVQTRDPASGKVQLLADS